MENRKENNQVVTDFVSLCIKYGSWMPIDRLYLQNRILAMIGLDYFVQCETEGEEQDSLFLLDSLVAIALENQMILNNQYECERLEAQLMDLLTPAPSVINAIFAEKYAQKPIEATDYFYKLSKKNDYIKTRAIAKNVHFSVDTLYGELEVTINLSKPEKDPKQIALEKSAPQSDYPLCLLCMENEGYFGRSNYPARTNHRIIRLNLNEEKWGFQYSPYAYYSEHCIILSQEHRPMVINRQTYERLLAIVTIFPHYFVGSNADLPIVGGSILSHDHYQGGRHDFPMAKAPIIRQVILKKYPKIRAGIVYWPMSVIRLQSETAEELVEVAEQITEKWRHYSDESLELRAFSEDGTPHHTVTPIVRRKGKLFELDLVLRDNNTSSEHPDGIFHPHQDVQHIKKENIGLIEVMGLAILPPRLKEELVEVEKYLLDKDNCIADYHLEWAKKLKREHIWTATNSEKNLQLAVGQVFMRVLEDAGVYKQDDVGQAGFDAFIQTLND